MAEKAQAANELLTPGIERVPIQKLLGQGVLRHAYGPYIGYFGHLTNVPTNLVGSMIERWNLAYSFPGGDVLLYLLPRTNTVGGVTLHFVSAGFAARGTNVPVKPGS